ncbi:hypothetical protein QCA50_009180 [Cerrena zonata]|uniref:Uncharacterized protein n=1 Tax=Cerrena zonata TaxID=2478898 RepID=A0AAW0GEF1_9APHY
MTFLKTPSVVFAEQHLTQANGEAENGDIQPKASSSKAPALNVKVTDYLVGTQLDEAISTNQDIVVFWPFAEGVIDDWTQAEALWYVGLLTNGFLSG